MLDLKRQYEPLQQELLGKFAVWPDLPAYSNEEAGAIGAKREGIDGEIERAETDDQDGERAGPERQSAMQFERMHVELTVDASRSRIDREADLAAYLVAFGQAGDRDPGSVTHGEGNLAMAGDAIALDGLDAQAMGTVRDRRRIEL